MSKTMKTNWDSFAKEKVFDKTGRCVGQLCPRMTQEQLAVSPAVQKWSTPKQETRK